MYKILMECYEKALLKQLDCNNEKTSDYYIEKILKPLENMIIDLIEDEKIDNKNIIKDLEDLGAYSPMSVLNEIYIVVYDKEMGID